MTDEKDTEIEHLRSTNNRLMTASINALEMIDGLYAWHSRVKKAGGTTCISGISAAHAMHESMSKQKPRINDLIIEPLRAALAAKP